jgi:hypothetical protein
MSVGSISPVASLAVTGAGAAPQAASDVAAVATQLVAEVAATLTENLPGSLPTAPPPSALTTMVGQAATQQGSLAPLLADLAMAVNSPAMPADARATAAQILAAQAPLGADVTAQQLQAATQSSGVFLEASLAASVVNGETAVPVNVQQDLKALLLQLTSELAPFVQAPTQAKTSGSTPTPRGMMVRGASDPPEPPVGGGPTTGQAASRPSLDPQAHTDTLVRTLQQEAQGALARVQLSQAASVERSGETTRWMFEVPIATPGGAGVAQFEISRDGRGPGAGDEAEPSWRARFSINAAPSGPVHADVLLGKGRARVTLMAEDAIAQLALAAHQDELTQALAAEQGPDVAVRVVGGAPPRPRQPAGQLVDRRS